MAFNLIELTDAHQIRQRFSLPRGTHFYPSEGSITYTNKDGKQVTEGACKRQIYYRLTGTQPDGGPSVYSEWIFALGRKVEEILVEQWKEMGIWVANSIRFKDTKRNISGELDCVVRDPETNELVVVEVKSFHGYNAKKEVMGNTQVKGKPKTQHLIQLMIYLDQCKDTVDKGKLIYYGRDCPDRREFDVSLVPEINENTGDVIHRPMVNGQIEKDWSLEDIYKSFEEVENHLNNNEIPNRDYQLIYDELTVESKFSNKEISKSKYEKWQKNPEKNPIGSWQCRWCNYCKTCWLKSD